MKHNDLNVFTYDYYDKRPRFIFKNIKQFFRNCKWAWQRATKGYADRDVWNFDYFLTCVMRDGLIRLADSTHGYPGDETPEGSTPEAWDAYLRKAANLLDRSIDRSFEDDQYYKNKYEDEWWDSVHKNPPEREEICQKYLEEERNIYEIRKANLEEAIDMIKNRFNSLWD